MERGFHSPYSTANCCHGETRTHLSSRTAHLTAPKLHARRAQHKLHRFARRFLLANTLVLVPSPSSAKSTACLSTISPGGRLRELVWYGFAFHTRWWKGMQMTALALLGSTLSLRASRAHRVGSWQGQRGASIVCKDANPGRRPTWTTCIGGGDYTLYACSRVSCALFSAACSLGLSFPQSRVTRLWRSAQSACLGMRRLGMPR